MAKEIKADGFGVFNGESYIWFAIGTERFELKVSEGEDCAALADRLRAALRSLHKSGESNGRFNLETDAGET